MKRILLLGSLPLFPLAVSLAACEQSQDFGAANPNTADGGATHPAPDAATSPGTSDAPDTSLPTAPVDAGPGDTEATPANDSGAPTPPPGEDASATDASAPPPADAGTLCPAAEGTDGVVIASGQPKGLYGLAVDANNVYFTVLTSPGSVTAVPKGGGAPLVLASGQPGPFGIASDGEHVFWSNTGSVSVPETVMTAPATGGPTSQFWSEGPFQGGGAFQLVTDGANLYWSGTASLQAEPVGGGPVRTFSAGTATFLSLFGGTLYMVGSTGLSMSIQSIPTSAAGSASTFPQTVAQLGASALVVGVSADASGVYWVDQGMAPGMGSIGGVSTGTTAVSTLVSGLSYAGSIASDGVDVYFTDSLGLRKVPVAGGTPSVVAQGEVGAINVKVDDTSVYWVNSCFGTVKKIGK